MRTTVKTPVCCIYKIESITTGNIYIGQTFDFYTRKRKHLFSLRHGTHHCKNLQNEWALYGEKAFVFDIVEVSDESSLMDLEKKYLECNSGSILNSPNGGARSGAGRKASWFKAKSGEQLIVSNRSVTSSQMETWTVLSVSEDKLTFQAGNDIISLYSEKN